MPDLGSFILARTEGGAQLRGRRLALFSWDDPDRNLLRVKLPGLGPAPTAPPGLVLVLKHLPRPERNVSLWAAD
jgi:hypothetical protein